MLFSTGKENKSSHVTPTTWRLIIPFKISSMGGNLGPIANMVNALDFTVSQIRNILDFNQYETQTL